MGKLLRVQLKYPSIWVWLAEVTQLVVGGGIFSNITFVISLHPYIPEWKMAASEPPEPPPRNPDKITANQFSHSNDAVGLLHTPPDTISIDFLIHWRQQTILFETANLPF